MSLDAIKTVVYSISYYLVFTPLTGVYVYKHYKYGINIVYKYQSICLIASIIWFGIMFYHLVHGFLWLLPSSWGFYDPEGAEWVTIRERYSFIFGALSGFLFSIYLPFLISKLKGKSQV